VNRVVLLTGASGFLGNALLEAFVTNHPDDCFFVLSRAASTRALQERFSGIDNNRLQFLHGDLRQVDLGLSTADRSILLEQTTEVWHLAASTTFDEKKAPELTSVNVDGTRELLELVRKARNLQNFYFTSTAYIVGADREVTPEDELPAVKCFNNTYEASKWQAEKLVRESGLPFTIFRPSVLLDRSDGQCGGNARMMYGYLLGVYSALSKHFRGQGVVLKNWLGNGDWLECDFRLVGHDSVTKNFVCVDDVVTTMLAIVNSPVVHTGRTYNLTSMTSINGLQSSEALENALRVKGIRYVGDTVSDPSPAEELALRHTRDFTPYLTHCDPEWPRFNTNTAVNGDHLHMTPGLFTFLLQSYVEQCVIGASRKSIHDSEQ
jgi:nucleoside-diphosphate-sugar epimerase